MTKQFKNLSGRWSGDIVGTNVGHLQLEITHKESRVTGIINTNESAGISKMNFDGRLDETRLVGRLYNFTSPQLDTIPAALRAQVLANDGRVTAEILDDDSIRGVWETSIGTTGEFLVRRTSELLKTATVKNLNLNRGVFIIMKISDDDDNYDTYNAIHRAAKTAGYPDDLIQRADKIDHNNRISNLVLSRISQTEVIIADITHERPNVYYELGYAHAIGREVIIIAKKGTQSHFDIQDYSVTFYTGLTDLETKLTSKIKRVITKG